ncbi:glycosyltransferase family 2 protein [Protaetiibacter intestinalis]|uniref:Glycosyltransferase family 2 protein n=2 Tax=Protaetiibacter intestinalis TaxID=2419774 RepID=A0A387B9X3_9MICO|nr:glycosyltransferase family 2 protein [Protaetiibacter intestinalis]
MDAVWDVLYDVLVVVLIVFVATGAVPVLTAAFHFLMVPLHSVVNHYRRADAYFPRVAVVIPAWNEALVIGATVERMLQLSYPEERLRVYVVDDASTDHTPEVMAGLVGEHPGRVVHLRREQGGQGKAHTLNHGLRIILGDDWAEAVLITDADVIFTPESLQKMTRHLADDKVGAVSAYIAEGSRDRNYMTRFIAIEYVLSQLAARRAQNVLGAQACLAGGAQLHSRANLEAIGGRIPTGTLAEDTVATFESQLHGRRMVFEPRAVVLAEEPRTIDALWKQRLRWARGNVQVSWIYRKVWFRPHRGHHLGNIAFGLSWFSIFLLPFAMVLSSLGLVGLLLLQSELAELVFRALWVTASVCFLFSMLVGIQLDPRIGRHAWREAFLFPGLVSFVVMIAALFPGLIEVWLPSLFGLKLLPWGEYALTLFVYVWISAAMLAAWAARAVEATRVGRWLSPLLIYLVGYGPMLCAITVDSYIKEWRRADASWIKTEKVGRVLG